MTYDDYVFKDKINLDNGIEVSFREPTLNEQVSIEKEQDNSAGIIKIMSALVLDTNPLPKEEFNKLLNNSFSVAMEFITKVSGKLPTNKKKSNK